MVHISCMYHVRHMANNTSPSLVLRYMLPWEDKFKYRYHIEHHCTATVPLLSKLSTMSAINRLVSSSCISWLSVYLLFHIWSWYSWDFCKICQICETNWMYMYVFHQRFSQFLSIFKAFIEFASYTHPSSRSACLFLHDPIVHLHSSFSSSAFII